MRSNHTTRYMLADAERAPFVAITSQHLICQAPTTLHSSIACFCLRAIRKHGCQCKYNADDVTADQMAVYALYMSGLPKTYWHCDVVDFQDRRSSTCRLVPHGYVVARYYKDVMGLRRGNKGWSVIEQGSTRSEYCDIPPGDGRFILPGTSIRGPPEIYHPFAGTPLHTTRKLDVAIKAWKDFYMRGPDESSLPPRFYRWTNDARDVACVATIARMHSPPSIAIFHKPIERCCWPITR
jgi:hypothetical protein